MSRCWMTAVVAMVLAPAIVSPHVSQGDEDGSPSDPFDCAAISLYNILNLQGHRVSLEQLSREIGPPGPGGHTMRQIREVAKGHGLALDGRILPKHASAIDRPMVLFVKQGKAGHFTVVRPVGHTGKLIQSLDRDGPDVFDANVLLDSPSWTGIALLPRRGTDVNARIILPVGSLVFGAGLYLYLRRRR